MIQNYNITEMIEIIEGFKFSAPLTGVRFYGFKESDFELPNIEFGKNYYTSVKNSKYNVIRIDAILFTTNGDYYIFHTPDNKLFAREFAISELHIHPIFDNVKDYKHWVLTNEINYNFENDQSIISNFIPFLNRVETQRNNMDVTEILGFYYDHSAQKVQKTQICFEYVWVDADGCHLKVAENAYSSRIKDAMNNLYFSREECFNDNFQLNLGEFKEDKVEETTFKISVTLEVTATTREEAEKAARQKIAYLNQ